MNFWKLIYKIKRVGNSVFTYNCASCRKLVRGKCLCPECTEKLSPPTGEDGLNFGYYYLGPAKDAMLCYKFNEHDYEYCLDTLCDWMLEGYSRLGSRDFDFVVPVPSFHERKNRFYYLAEKFALLADLPFKPKLLRKIKETKKQHKIKPDERRTNLIGAFSANPAVSGKKILLVDDVMTTGSTVDECRKTLLAAGAAKITVLTVLKTYYSEEEDENEE